jgi:hypothetical protein
MLHAETNTGFAVAEWAFVIVGIIGVMVIVFLGSVFFNSWMARVGAIVAGTLVWSAALIGIFIGANYPLDSAYHTYVPITLTVQTNSSRILNDGNSNVSQSFALTDAAGNTYRCDDTRCAPLAKGDVVTLLCQKEYETNGTPGYVCNWGKLGANT